MKRFPNVGLMKEIMNHTKECAGCQTCWAELMEPLWSDEEWIELMKAESREDDCKD